MSQIMVGRQPIFDRELNVHGYELLFRSPEGGPARDADGMTAQVLLGAGLDLGLERLVGPKLAFINATRAFLVGEDQVPLPPEQTVVEVLEDTSHDAEVIAGCRALAAAGFTIALDDYVWADGDEELLALASIVKLDLLAMDTAALDELAERCREFDVRLLAEKVETREQMAHCHDLGFELFQGYLLSRPEIVQGQGLSPHRLTSLRLVGALCDPNVSADKIEQIVHADAGLSYRILRAAGSGAGAGLRRPIKSIKEGIVLLGQRRLRSWAVLMLMADGHEGSDEQLQIAMTRARMCELMAKQSLPRRQDEAFTVGLLSAMDLIFDSPLEEVVAELALAAEIGEAVIERAGDLGAILEDVISYELGAEGLNPTGGLHLVDMERCYVDALIWSTEVCGVLAAA